MKQLNQETEKKTEIDPISFESQNADLVHVSNNYQSIKSSLDGLKEAKAGINISPEYYEFDTINLKIRGIFLGFGKFDRIDEKTGEVSTLNTIVWIDENRNMWSNAGIALVGAMGRVKKGTAVEIEYLGTKKVKMGNMKRYAVRPLM